MPRLPFIASPLPDELLYSYFIRLSKENCFDDIRSFMGHYVFSDMYENKDKKYVAVSYDIRDDLYHFAYAVTGNPENQVLPFFLQTALFPGLAPLMLRAHASHYVGLLSKYRNHSKILSPCELLVQELRFCPMCHAEMQKQHGFIYYTRAHQMPGVTVCHRHGCALHQYDGKPGQELEQPLPSHPLASPKKGWEYAIFCRDFLNAQLECDIADVANAIMQRLGKQGYSTQNYRDLNTDMQEYSELMSISPQQIIRCIRQKDQLHVPSLLTLLLYLFQDVSTLKTYLYPNTDLKERFSAAIDGAYTLLSPLREDIVELKCCSCGNYFLSTPERIRSAWGCPTCDSTLDHVSLFQRLFRASAQDDYELCSDFQSMNQPIRVFHKACGREYEISAKEFLEHGSRCRCEYALGEAEVQAQLDLIGNFKVQNYKSTVKPITIFHQDCGNTFHVMYHIFLKTPRCRVCQRKKADHFKPESEFLQNVADLVGDEYTVLEPYTASKIPISIRHNPCGIIQKYAPKHFLDGQRCRVCKRRISDQDFAKIISEVSLGRYACTERIPPYTVVIRDTVSGEDKTMTARRALQELFRPTSSPILPLEKRNLKVSMPINQKDVIMNWINAHYDPSEPIVLKTLQVDGLEKSSVKNGLADLAKEGKLTRIGIGVYSIPGRAKK